MTARRPLVLINGTPQQLPAGDSLAIPNTSRLLFSTTPPAQPVEGDQWVEVGAGGSLRQSWGWIFAGGNWISPLLYWDVDWDGLPGSRQFNLAIDPAFTVQLASSVCCLYVDAAQNSSHHWKVDLFPFGSASMAATHTTQNQPAAQWQRYTASPSAVVRGASSLLMHLFVIKNGALAGNCWGAHRLTYRYLRQ